MVHPLSPHARPSSTSPPTRPRKRPGNHAAALVSLVLIVLLLVLVTISLLLRKMPRAPERIHPALRPQFSWARRGDRPCSNRRVTTMIATGRTTSRWVRLAPSTSARKWSERKPKSLRSSRMGVGRTWRKLSTAEQRVFAHACTILNKYEQYTAKAEEKAQRKRAREQRRNASKKQKRFDERLGPLSSLLLNPGQRARQSESHQRLRAPSKQRRRGVRPNKPSHLNDKAAAGSKSTALRAFEKHARSITLTGEIDTTNWGSSSSALVLCDNLEAPKCHPRPEKGRNIVNSATESSRQTKVRIYLSNGGLSGAQDMVKTLLASGKFDSLVRERHAAIEQFSRPTASNVDIQSTVLFLTRRSEIGV